MEVLLLGGTGRTGGRVLTQLLARGVSVRAVVRSAERLPAGAAGDPKLAVTGPGAHAGHRGHACSIATADEQANDGRMPDPVGVDQSSSMSPR